MIQLRYFSQETCPPDLKEQLIALMRLEWPQAFPNEDENVSWPDNRDTHPMSFVLLDNEVVISHVAVPNKRIHHEEQHYHAFGLSEVITHPSYRGQGFGLKLIQAAASYIEKQNPDIGIFTCKPSLVPFYSQGGWEPFEETNLIGGTRSKPFRSDLLGLVTMIRFYSDKARQLRADFERTDVYLELGENKLW